MLENPSGPSTTTSICPRIAQMGVFENNTVHSQGWFALWIHEIYYPTKDGMWVPFFLCFPAYLDSFLLTSHYNLSVWFKL